MPTDPFTISQLPRRRCRRPLVALCVLGASLALAACGSSASGSGSASKASGATSSNGSASRGGQFTALRTCLQKQGITLPAPPSGTSRQPGAPGGGGAGGARRLLQPPAGVSQEQFQAALKKCGAGNFGGRGAGVNSPTARAALAKYATCLRQNGINVPEPNTSGNGPVFNTKGIDTSSSKFKAAQSKCQGNLKGAFPGGGPGGGAPPSGAPNGA